MTDWPLSDEILLARLSNSLIPATDGPSADAIEAFRQAVGAHRTVRAHRLSLWRRTRLALAALIGTTALGAGVAWAAGAPLPSPLRSLASGLGLPVDSPAVSATRNADDALSNELNAMAHGAGSKTAVAKDANALSNRLATLNAAQRTQLGSTPNSLLSQAQQVTPGSAAGSSPSGTTTTSPPGPTTTTVPGLSLPTLPPSPCRS